MIVWLVSYPRSGNTLTRSVFNHFFGLRSFSIYGDQTDIGANEALGELVGHIPGDKDTIDLDALRRDEALHLIKTHELPNQTMSEKDIFVHIVRDGRDSVLSYYRYLHNVAEASDTQLSDVISGRVIFGTWAQHTLRWKQHSTQKYFRFHYEDIVKDIPTFAQKISEFLSLEANSEPFPGIEKFQQVGKRFIGKGQVGGWRSNFSDEELSLFNFYNGLAMKELGYYKKDNNPKEVEEYFTFMSDLDRSNKSYLQKIKALSEKNRNLSIEVEKLAIQEAEKRAVQEAEIKSLKQRTNYLEPKVRKHLNRVNRLRSIVGIRQKKLPWD